MDYLQVKVNKRKIAIIFVLVINISYYAEAWNTEYVSDGLATNHFRPHIVTLERQRRDVAPAAPPALQTPEPKTNENATTPAVSQDIPQNVTKDAQVTPTAPAPNTQTKATDDSNRTKNITEKHTVSVTHIPPLLGENGTGILKDTTKDPKTPQVSEPIVPDDNLNVTEVLEETPEMIKAQHNLTALTYDHHQFYNSSFIGNTSYFNEYWANITKPASDLHLVLSNSHRRASSVVLRFQFPFYGQMINNITVATGGFIYMGEHVHNWLAATQYIAPLMANFDTSITNDSAVRLSDDGEKFTVIWENVTLQENSTLKFTFAATLYKNGDIVFAYKNVPVPIQSINETSHPVKIGISDAYIQDKIVFYVRRKTIYEYHRVNFKNHNITNSTVLRLTALPTCMQYDSCDTCLNHNTGFNCSWCVSVGKCSSGTDKNKQDWTMRNCERMAVTQVSSCPPKPAASPNGSSTAYVTDSQGDSVHDSVVHTFETSQNDKPKKVKLPESDAPLSKRVQQPDESHSPVGGVVAAFVAVALVCSVAAWAVYAFRNPHTRSGQLFIKYRPSQWSWRRGEARYTAATIHM